MSVGGHVSFGERKRERDLAGVFSSLSSYFCTFVCLERVCERFLREGDLIGMFLK